MPEAQNVGLGRVRQAQAILMKSFPSATGSAGFPNDQITHVLQIPRSQEKDIYFIFNQFVHFKVRSSYFRGKSPTLYVCKLDILALLLFLSYIWQNGGGWELKSSILDAGLWLSWMGFTYLFWFFFLNWSIVNLQCWVSFKCTAKWFSYMCVCVYFSDLDVFSLILNKAILF